MHNNLNPDYSLSIPDAAVQYVGGFFAFAKANSLQQHITQQTPWRQNNITIFGKTYPEPRLTQLYGDTGMKYGYSGISYDPLPWTDTLKEIKNAVEKQAETTFNICLLNLYRDGQDSNGWHADNEAGLGKNPIIASVSFGEVRDFHLKHNENKEWRFKFPLEHGSLLVMAGSTQHAYKHQIAKTKKVIQERLNLTFRKVVVSQ